MSAVHFIHDGILFLLLIYGTIAILKPVAASSLALCEGGQTCLPPKECCAQGCCYLYAPPGAPRVPLANNDHMLSMLFLNHWYFWCFVLAILLALLCTCSLWKKRRQLCGWDTSARHSQSEGDSAGSCYAPPQYSRCNSFHIHAPPPYTEVASKPDLYPLVFSYTDPGKGNGANYLMVQYFRNYIVQPVGSISGTSTVDSLSSSFICNANEANTLVPPPYSRAASPDMTMSFRNYLMPRSASQQVCLTTAYGDRSTADLAPLQSSRSHVTSYQRDDESLLERERQQQHREDDELHSANTNPNNTTINHNNFSSNNVSLMECPNSRSGNYHHPLVNFLEHGPNSRQVIGGSEGSSSPAVNASSAVEASRAAPITAGSVESFQSPESGSLVGENARTSSSSHHTSRHISCLDGGNELCDLSNTNGNPLHFRGNSLVCKLCCSTGDITGAGAPNGISSQYRTDLTMLHKSLETCCHVNLRVVHGNSTRLANLTAASEDSILNAEDAARKSTACAVSSAGSNVSSLVNLDSSSSPPRATSPTAEVRVLLEQIRQLHHHDGQETGTVVTRAHPGSGSPTPTLFGQSTSSIRTPPRQGGASTVRLHTSVTNAPAPAALAAYRRPSSLIGRRNKLFSKPSSQQQYHQQPHQGSNSKAMYIPISFTQNCMVPSTSGRLLRSPASGVPGSSGTFHNRGRSRYCWMSKSAPTTPGAAPGSFAGGPLSDNRPLLLNEQEEDGEQNM